MKFGAKKKNCLCAFLRVETLGEHFFFFTPVGITGVKTYYRNKSWRSSEHSQLHNKMVIYLLPAYKISLTFYYLLT